MNLPVAVGFGCFFAWQLALVSLLFPASYGLAFSPVACQSLACCLLSAVSVWGVVKNVGTASSRGLCIGMGASAVVGSLAAGLVAMGPAKAAPWSFAAAVAVGCAVAVAFYAWASVISVVEPSRRMGTVVAGLAVSSALSLAMAAFGGAGLCVVVVGLGLVVFLAFAAINAKIYQQGEPQPLVFRPASSNHFKLLFLALVLYAFVFGSVSGTTAERASEVTTRDFNIDMALAMLAISLVLLAVLAAVRRPVRLQAVARVLTPVLAVLFLLHILLQGSGNGWLPVLTLGFWQIVQVFVLLLLIALAQSGYASLSFVFPLGWSLVSLGFGLGALFGQLVGGVFGAEATAVQGVTVVLVIVAVVASSILAAAQYPTGRAAVGVGGDGLGDGAPAINGAGEGDAHDGGLPGAQGAPGAPASDDRATAPDPIAAACADLANKHGLSGREAEVFDLLARGNTRASIADKLCISENTVRVHVKNIYAKLYIHSKQQLIDMVDKLVQKG